MERRQFGRRQNMSAGWIKMPGRPRLACRVIGLTPKGALLELQVPAWLPFQFELFIESEKSTHTCEIRHSQPDRLGVHFVDFEKSPVSRRGTTVVDDWMGPKPKQ